MSPNCYLCAACNEPKNTTVEGSALCPECEKIVDIIKNKPELFSRLSHIASQDQSEFRAHIEEEQELPDVLDAVRYRTSDRDANTWYISISEMNNQPVEIFASTAFETDRHLQSRISSLTTITRLLSLMLRHIFMGERITLDKTITQLDRSSRQSRDLPAMLSDVLAKYKKRDHE